MQEFATNLRRKFTGEPDAGKLHVRFDEGRGSRDAHHRASSPTLLVNLLLLTNLSHVTPHLWFLAKPLAKRTARQHFFAFLAPLREK